MQSAPLSAPCFRHPAKKKHSSHSLKTLALLTMNLLYTHNEINLRDSLSISIEKYCSIAEVSNVCANCYRLWIFVWDTLWGTVHLHELEFHGPTAKSCTFTSECSPPHHLALTADAASAFLLLLVVALISGPSILGLARAISIIVCVCLFP